MKKQISTLLLALAAMTTLCYAQDSNLDLSSKFTTGLKFGLNYSNVYDSKGENFQADSKVGYVGGLFFSIPIGKTIGIQPEVLFSQRGFKGSGMLLGSAYKLTRTTNYLDIPLLFALKPSKTITLLAGPQFSFLLKQKDKFENGNVNVLQVQEFEADNIRKNTLCF